MFDQDRLADELIDLLVDEYHTVLKLQRKVATATTLESIEGREQLDLNNLKVTILADKSLTYIENGRRKGAKLPVRKVNGKFELVPRLQRWVKAVGYTGNHYLLARGISRRGIKGVPITDLVLERSRGRAIELIARHYARYIAEQVVSDIKTAFQ